MNYRVISKYAQVQREIFIFLNKALLPELYTLISEYYRECLWKKELKSNLRLLGGGYNYYSNYIIIGTLTCQSSMLRHYWGNQNYPTCDLLSPPSYSFFNKKGKQVIYKSYEYNYGRYQMNKYGEWKYVKYKRCKLFG